MRVGPDRQHRTARREVRHGLLLDSSAKAVKAAVAVTVTLSMFMITPSAY